MPLSNNQPDPIFPPVPPAAFPGTSYVAGPGFGDLSGLPTEYQPIELEGVDHMTTTGTGLGGDPLSSDMEVPASPELDTSVSESPQGIEYS